MISKIIFIKKFRKVFFNLIFIILFLSTLLFFFIYKNPLKFKNILSRLIPSYSTRIINEETLINEVRNVNKLIPLEIELSESIVIDKSISDINILKKTKTITYYAQCSYSIDLSNLTSKDIFVDEDLKELSITLSPPEVFSITIDEDKTKYSEPDLGLLRFGDITLSSEDYGEIRTKLNIIFKNKMQDKKLQDRVIENVTLTLEKLTKDIIGESYTINIKIKST